MILFGKKIDSILFSKILLLIAFCIFAYFRARKENELGDFHVFWFAGKTILSGGDIYFTQPGLRSFIYPPFASLIFIPLALLPFNVACFLFFIINLTCFIFTAHLIKKILRLYIQDENILKYSYFASLLLVFKISWNNLMMVQVNQLVYLFVILGVYKFLAKKENWAIFYFCIAISMKVFPILFAFWVVIRGSKTAIPKFILGAIICIGLPFLFTGPTKGIDQLNWFYKDFILGNAKSSNVGFGYASQSLPGLLHRTLVTSTLKDEPSYTIVNIGENAAKNIILFSQISLFTLMCFILLCFSFKKIKYQFTEPALVILTIHLISACTWKAHMVGMILVFAVISTDIIKRYKNNSLNKIIKLFIGYLAIVSILGQILIGKKWQMYLGAYGDYTFEMLFCLIYILHMIKTEFSSESIGSSPNFLKFF